MPLYSTQLNEVYNKSVDLSRWYKKIRIDSFSQGSVLVDYFVELQNVPNQLNTLDIKSMFHEALLPVVPLQPMKKNKSADEFSTSTEITSTANDTQTADQESLEVSEAEEIYVRPNMLLGKFVLDPISTDFIGKKPETFCKKGSN